MPGQFKNTGTNPDGKLSLVNNSNSGNLTLAIPQICFNGMQNVAGVADSVGFFFGGAANIEQIQIGWYANGAGVVNGLVIAKDVPNQTITIQSQQFQSGAFYQFCNFIQ
jgi:hypothetical protein